MSTVSDIVSSIETIAPSRFAAPYDKVGLQVGEPSAKVEKAFVSLDRSYALAKRAVEENAQLLVTHHPLIWDPISSLTDRDLASKTVRLLASSGLALIAAHTNWDCAIGGVNCELASKLNLQNPKPFGWSAEIEVLKMQFYLPKGNADSVIESILSEFEKKEIGLIGEYSRCAFMSIGTGTFKPSKNAHPSIGESLRIESVPEVKVEISLRSEQKLAAQAIVRHHHPYEEPVIEFLAREPIQGIQIGRIGKLIQPISFEEFVAYVNSSLGTNSMAWKGNEGLISAVSVVGGAAADEWLSALEQGADAFVTGEVPQHIALEASESGLSMLASGHYATEQPGVEVLCTQLAAKHPDVEWILFEPKPSFAGRPL